MRLIMTFLIFAVVFFVSACRGIDNSTPEKGLDDISCFDRGQKSSPTFLDSTISVIYENRTPSEVIRDLQESHKFPISYIQSADMVMSLGVKEASVRSLLQDLIARMPGSACRIVAGHLVIYPDMPDLKAFVQDIDVIDKPRGVAAREYIKLAGKQTEYFKHVEVLLAGVVESPMFEERVSLSRRAKAIDHLVQILGDDQSIFFSIDRSPAGEFIFSLGSV